jgi:beta-glucosidase
VTFEKRLEDRSSFASYHDDDHDRHVALTDGIFTGYRHFDRAEIEPQFCFGFGLSYTQFAYENLTISKPCITSSESVTLEFDIINQGIRAGSESAQVYVGDVESIVPRPRKELKGFTKVMLAPGERRRVAVTLEPRALSFYDATLHDFRVEPGKFQLLVGASCQDIRLTCELEVA